MYRHLFGPVPSRRLGLSLGVDLVVDKTCSFDCVFCEVGRTRDLTLDRKEYVAPDLVLDEIRAWLKEGGKADYITLAGKGEPTLNTSFGKVIREIKKMTKTPVAILSNGSLFFLEDVRRDAAEADVVKVSLGGWNQESMNRLNRPYRGVDFDRIIEGYGMFRDCFSGQLWLEVLLVEGINDHVDDVALISELAESFAPDKVQLNTVVRPGTEMSAGSVSMEKMMMLAKLFDPPAEIIVDFSGSRPGKCANIREILIRRPCTLDDLVSASGLDKSAVSDLIDERAEDWSIRSREVDGRTYYLIPGEEPK